MGIIVLLAIFVVLFGIILVGGAWNEGRSQTETGPTEGVTPYNEAASRGGKKRLRWLDPDAEKIWKEIIQSAERLSLQPRMRNVDSNQAEGQLKEFGTQSMPNAYARYQEARAKALDLEQIVKENFPDGEASDPTGGTLLAKAEKKLAVAVARMFRRRDELCFFLLFRQAGVFSEEKLAEYDSRPISIRLEKETSDWPDDTPRADTALSAGDAAFAAKRFPETHASYQRLCRLFDEGAKQYGDLRRTALALDAPRARFELAMFKIRLGEIQKALERYKNGFSVHRLSHAIGETTDEKLAALDHPTAVQIQKFERKMEVNAYISNAVAIPDGTTMLLELPGGEKQGLSDEAKKKTNNMSPEEMEQLAGEKMSGKSGNDMGFWQFMRENCDGSTFLGWAFVYLCKKKPGCAFLLVLILIGVVIYLANR